MKIAILGAGNVGGALGKLWASQGHEVCFGARDPLSAKVQAALKGAGPTARVASPAEAVAAADLVLLAVPWAAVADLAQAGIDWQGKIVMDAVNRMPPGGHASSMGEEVARALHGARVVKAFNTTGSANMNGQPYGDQRVDIHLCSDDAAAKAIVADFVRGSGFEPVDCGPLANSALTESLAALWVTLAYRLGNGPNIMFKLARRQTNLHHE